MPKFRLNSPYLTASSLRDYVRSIKLDVSLPEGYLSAFAQLKRKLPEVSDLTYYPQLLMMIHHIQEASALRTIEDQQALWTQLNAVDDWDASAADTQFSIFNMRYGYFNIPPNAEELRLFCELTMRCYAIMRLYENTTDEQLAYDYAYKLMVLFVDDINRQPLELWVDELEKHMAFLEKTFESGTLKPYHDTFIVRLPHLLNTAEINDLLGWRALIRKYGIPALPYFNMADKIEAKHAQAAPSTLIKAEEIAAECDYLRSAEDVEFARLCRKYRVVEERFNQSLDYMSSGWPKKLTDTLPDLSITEGTFKWSKLPVDDKRGLILGDITDCCQSIGGDSEQCVKDAVSLPTSGLYILKDKHKIIGQAYVWISQTGNLCLDSIECLPHSIKDDVLKNILHHFATAVLATHPELKRVTIGAGGKTPKGLFPNTVITEMIREGMFYEDAEMQYCIAQADSLSPTQRLALNAVLEPYSQSFQECINYVCHYLSDTTNIVEQLEALLKNYPEVSDELTPGSLMCYLSMMHKYKESSISLHDLIPIDCSTDKYLDLPLTTRAARLMSQATDTIKLFNLLPYIPENYRIEALRMGYGDFGGKTLLQCYIGHVSSVSNIIALCPEEHVVEIVKPALSHAVRVLSDSLEVLLKVFSPPQCFEYIKEKNSWGETLLHKAVPYPQSFAALLRPLSVAQRFEVIKIKDGEGKSVLYLAASKQKQNRPFLNGSFVRAPLEIILRSYPQSQLLEALNETHDYGKTVLHEAVKGGNLIAILKILPENQCITAIDMKDDEGKSVLYYEVARIQHDFEALENLLSVLSLNSYTLLTHAVEEVNLPFARCKDLFMKVIEKKPSCSKYNLEEIHCAENFGQLKNSLNELIAIMETPQDTKKEIQEIETQEHPTGSINYRF